MKSKCFFKQASSFLCHHHLLSAVMLAGFLGACGRQTGSPLRKKIAIFTQEDLQRSRPYGTLERAAVSGGQDTGEAVGQLVFRSFKKQYKNRDVKLGIKLGWFGFGTGMHVETGLTQFTTGGLVLSKVPSDDQAAIFTDDKGTLQVRPGEEFTGFCAYEGTYGLTVGSQGEISFAGVRLDQEVGQQKILSLEVVSPLFAIPEGAHLGSLEDLCEKLYEDRYQEILQKDLSRGVKAQLTIHRHYDPRIQALEKILLGQWEKIEETEESWSGGDLRVVMEQETIRVEGRVDLGPKAYHFNHLFRERMQESTGAGASLVLEESMVTPKTLDGRYQKALLLAGYLARNKAAYEAAVRAQRPFTVDDSLLKLTRSLVDDF